MVTFIEPLYKSANEIQFGWNPEPVSGVLSYNVYVGQVPGTLTSLATGISTQFSQDPKTYKKIVYTAQIAAVQTALGIPATMDFSTLLLYWAITYVTLAGESAISGSRVVEVPPVGILGKTSKEDPTVNRHMFGFSDELQRWVKAAVSGSGALIVSSSDYFAANVTSEYSYDSSGKVLTEKSYLSDRTSAGAPAKLITYTYSGSNVIKKVITDSTV